MYLTFVVFAVAVLARSKCTLKHASDRENLRCDVEGSINKPLLYSSPQYVKDLQSCADLCLLREPESEGIGHFGGCGFISFSPSSGFCRLFSPLSRQYKHHNNFTASSTTNEFFYDRGCFHCALSCPQPTDVNLVADPGFELSRRVGPWIQAEKIVASNLGRVVPKGHNSPNAFHCPMYRACGLEQGFRVCPNTLYTIRVDLKYLKRDPHISPIILNELMLYTFDIAPDEWHTIETSFVSAPTADSFVVTLSWFSHQNYHNWYVDNFRVLPVHGPIPTPSPAPNALRNPGFETGHLAPWTAGSGTASPHTTFEITSPGLSSPHAFEWQLANHHSAGTGGSGTLSQQVNVTSGALYLLTFDSRSPDALYSHEVAYREVRHGSGGSASYAAVNDFYPYGGQDEAPRARHRFRFLFTPLGDAVVLDVNTVGQADAPANVTRVLMDNFRLVRLCRFGERERGDSACAPGRVL